MKTEKLTTEAFAPYGSILSQKRSGGSVDNAEFTYTADPAVFELGGEVTAGILEGKSRAVILEKMERHLDTPEILFQILEDGILFVGTSKGGPAGIGNIKPFSLKQGDTVLLYPGTWHWVPFPEKAEKCVTQVIFKSGTSDSDCQIMDLPEPLVLSEGK